MVNCQIVKLSNREILRLRDFRITAFEDAEGLLQTEGVAGFANGQGHLGRQVVHSLTRLVLIEESGGIGAIDEGIVVGSKHVAAPRVLLVGQFQLSQQGGGNVALVHEN